MNIEHGTPLVFAINSGVGPECAKFNHLLADRIAFKYDDRYETVVDTMYSFAHCSTYTGRSFVY